MHLRLLSVLCVVFVMHGARKRGSVSAANDKPGQSLSNDNSKEMLDKQAMDSEMKEIESEYKDGLILMDPTDDFPHISPAFHLINWWGFSMSAPHKGPHILPGNGTASRRQSTTLIENLQNARQYQCPNNYKKELIFDRGPHSHIPRWYEAHCICPKGWYDLHRNGMPYRCLKEKPKRWNKKTDSFQVSVIVHATLTDDGFNERLHNSCKRLRIATTKEHNGADKFVVNSPWDKGNICIALFDSDDCDWVKEYVLITGDTVLQNSQIDWRDKPKSAMVLQFGDPCPISDGKFYLISFATFRYYEGNQAGVLFYDNYQGAPTRLLLGDLCHSLYDVNAVKVGVQAPWDKDNICIAIFNSVNCDHKTDPYVLLVGTVDLDNNKHEYRGFKFSDKTRSARVISWKKCPGLWSKEAFRLPPYEGFDIVGHAYGIYY